MLLILAVAAFLPSCFCKVFTRCELARELSQPRHRIPAAEIATWVCIARHESEFNTSAIGNLNADGSGDHGLFQISDQYWCSPPGVGLACGLNCDQLEDDNIKDDVVCARRIYRAHKRRTGNGFTAWAVYGFHCSGDVSAYTEGCDQQDTTTTESTWSTSTPTSELVSSTTEIPSSERTITPSLSPSRASTLDSPRERMSIAKGYHLHNTIIAKSKVTPVDNLVVSQHAEDSRTPGTSSRAVQRPRFADPDLDPAAAWLRIHNDPRFLDEFS